MEEEKGHPTEFRAAEAPKGEDLAQGAEGLVVALLAVGALEEAALGAPREAMEEGKEVLVGEVLVGEVLVGAVLVGATEEVAQVGAGAQTAMAEAGSVGATAEAASAGEASEEIVAFSLEMKK